MRSAYSRVVCPELTSEGEMMSDEQFDNQSPTFDPNRLLNALLSKLNLKNDAQLCRALDVAPPLISKIRHRRLPVGSSLLIRMHEASGLSIAELRELMGDRRQKHRISDVQFKPKQGPGSQRPSA